MSPPPLMFPGGWSEVSNFVSADTLGITQKKRRPEHINVSQQIPMKVSTMARP